jgi:hypothetical protein
VPLAQEILLDTATNGVAVFSQAANLFRTSVPQPRFSNRLDSMVQ